MNALLEKSSLCTIGNKFLHLLEFVYTASFETLRIMKDEFVVAPEDEFILGVVHSALKRVNYDLRAGGRCACARNRDDDGGGGRRQHCGVSSLGRRGVTRGVTQASVLNLPTATPVATGLLTLASSYFHSTGRYRYSRLEKNSQSQKRVMRWQQSEKKRRPHLRWASLLLNWKRN